MTKDFWQWLFSRNPREKRVNDPAEKLLNGMRVTARCRFNASVRLRRQSSFSFFTTTVLSLGLIFIPLMQNSDIDLAFSVKALNMLQIFLAVAVLVYSVVNATARYEVRAELLNECGDRIKALIRELRYEINKASSDGSMPALDPFHEKYELIAKDAENHTRADFALATLEMKDDYTITGIPRIYERVRASIMYGIPLCWPLLLILFEAVLIPDMLGMTSVLVPYLNPQG